MKAMRRQSRSLGTLGMTMEEGARSREESPRPSGRGRIVSCPYWNEGGGTKKRGGEAMRNRLECGLRRLAMAHRFTVIFEKEAEGGYHVFCPALPGCHTQSETVEEGVENIREAIELYVESLVEDGLPIPTEDILIKPIEIPA